MSLPACLVTSSPTFEDPERTPPFLVGPSAQPDIRYIKVVDATAVKPPAVEFSAQVRSEDNGDDVLGRLVLDYGVPLGGPDYPYQDILKDLVSVPASTMDDESRVLTAVWFPRSDVTTAGCHTVTLFTTHEMNFEKGCPVDPTDFDSLTWTVLVCTEAPCCDPTLPPDAGGCPPFQCPAVDESARCDAPTAGAPQ